MVVESLTALLAGATSVKLLRNYLPIPSFRVVNDIQQFLVLFPSPWGCSDFGLYFFGLQFCRGFSAFLCFERNFERFFRPCYLDSFN
mmetsp:Transcript_44861/g.93981  ORF Transcript_44861/g.93981 Transcript_44861/m.93981 type:complete len:87 (-) Transcript_44861:709-969(-)